MLATHAVFSIAFARFIAFVETRRGAVLEDPFLHYLPRVDVSWHTFALIYTAVLVALWGARKSPERVVLALQTWSLMLVIRMLVMYLLPLDPPTDIIPLGDPFAELVLGQSTPAVRDLFFSGHTATLLVLALTASGRLRPAMFALTFGVATLVLVQRVHYTIDVIATPFFVVPIYRVLKKYWIAGAD
ncbi:MAG: phosphatase PAP2-related protein [Myxococcota bacterium]